MNTTVLKVPVLVAVLLLWAASAHAQLQQAVGTVLQIRRNGLILTDVRLRLPSSEKPADGQPFFEYDGGRYMLTGQDLFMVTTVKKFVDGDILSVGFQYKGVYSYTNAAEEMVTLRMCVPVGPIAHFDGTFIGPVYRGWHPASTNDHAMAPRGTNIVVQPSGGKKQVKRP